MKIIIWALYSLASIYYILDYFHTVALIQCGAKEINPFINWLVSLNNSWLTVLYYKVTTVIILGILLIIYLRRKEC